MLRAVDVGKLLGSSSSSASSTIVRFSFLSLSSLSTVCALSTPARNEANSRWTSSNSASISLTVPPRRSKCTSRRWMGRQVKIRDREMAKLRKLAKLLKLLKLLKLQLPTQAAQSCRRRLPFFRLIEAI